MTDQTVTEKATAAASATASAAGSAAQDAATQAAGTARAASQQTAAAAERAVEKVAPAKPAAPATPTTAKPATAKPAAPATGKAAGKADAAPAAPPERSIDEIEADLDATRERLAERLDALAEYMTPRNLVGRQVDKVKRVFVDEYGGIKPEPILVTVGVVAAIVSIRLLRRRGRD